MAEEENGQTALEGGSGAADGAPVEPAETPELAELRKKTEELEQSVTQLKDQLLRKAAEFDNYKKRTEAETISVIRFANEDLLLKLLPVVDDLERSFRALGANSGIGDPAAADPPDGPRKEAAFIGGVELIHGKLKKILEQVGLKPFESAGKPFDPELHDALLQVPRDDMPHHTVVEEIDRGYQLNDRVIRHARVIVSSKTGSGDQ
ncbi:MAG TPA: nucleotide exchange factor GrpE [Bacteroidota bacterium]|nr:nucleotide exchange factor GrpE [Bacteroidota bacterium]